MGNQEVEFEPGTPYQVRPNRSEDEALRPLSLSYVETISGAKLPVLSDEEVDWVENTQKKYLEEHKFTERTDLNDLDRLISLELLQHRWSWYLAAEQDYLGNPVDMAELRRNVKDNSASINMLKRELNLNKSARDEALNKGNVADIITELRRRAKVFGNHRENQLRAALVLMNELSSVVNTFYRADDEEKKKLGFETEAQILEWLRDNAIPRYHEIDNHFRENEQKYWRRDLLPND